TLKMPAFEWVHVQLHQQKGMISLSPPTICNSASAAIVQSASDVQCSRLLKTTNSQKGCYRRFDLQPIG
ncbi:hypothetical protein, partial [Escherichia coli]